MRRVVRLFAKLLAVSLVVVVALLAPVAYVETMCQGTAAPQTHTSLLPPEARRAEARTLMTYPEWHIVHAYDDYAEVIRTGDPHDYGFFAAIRGFWSSLCVLTEDAAALGPVDGGTKQMVYVIGVSFTAELALKALYEETLGRAASWVRGATLANLDHLTAQQAADYAAFLQQVPWYKWPFAQDVEALKAAEKTQFRDTERRLAVGLEYSAKAAYAGLIAQAVDSVGADALTLRMLVEASGRDLSSFADVTVIGQQGAYTELQAPRYRVLTHLLAEMAADGIVFVEIAGNDDIMFTTVSPKAQEAGAMLSMARQGHGDHRHLYLVKVPELAAALNAVAESAQHLEHVHDY